MSALPRSLALFKLALPTYLGAKDKSLHLKHEPNRSHVPSEPIKPTRPADLSVWPELDELDVVPLQAAPPVSAPPPPPPPPAPNSPNAPPPPPRKSSVKMPVASSSGKRSLNEGEALTPASSPEGERPQEKEAGRGQVWKRTQEEPKGWEEIEGEVEGGGLRGQQQTGGEGRREELEAGAPVRKQRSDERTASSSLASSPVVDEVAPSLAPSFACCVPFCFPTACYALSLIHTQRIQPLPSLFSDQL